MFSRSQRISSALLDEILAKGHSLRSARFSVAIIRDTGLLEAGHDQKEAKFGVLVPKKIANKATKRNHLRRQARAWVREYLTARPFPTGSATVIFVNTSWEGQFPAILQTELKQLLLKVEKMM